MCRAFLYHSAIQADFTAPRRQQDHHRTKVALLLVLWDESPDNEKRERKNISKRQKNIEHGGDNSCHAQCYVFEVLENYQKDARQSSPDLESSLR
jgi:hypothetical protein